MSYKIQAVIGAISILLASTWNSMWCLCLHMFLNQNILLLGILLGGTVILDSGLSLRVPCKSLLLIMQSFQDTVIIYL